MWVTSASQRAGLLVAIISGGRPSLKQRPTARHVDSLRAAGVGDIVWVTSSQDAPVYERDGLEIAVYEREWAVEYARRHWVGTTPLDHDGFLGAFPGREWSCLEAERRGFWGVLQLDDNIIDDLHYLRHTAAAIRIIQDNGGMGFYADLLSAVALSTNARTVGAQLSSAHPGKSDARVIARPGFPYSLFVERVGDGREHWHGPYEDDILHSFQYGDRPDGATAAVMPMIRYRKESTSKTGMRANYDSTRSVQLQRMVPQGASIGVRATRSNGRGKPRVFHTMTAGAIRNPVTVHDSVLFSGVRARLERLARDWLPLERESNQAKVHKRLARSQGTAR